MSLASFPENFLSILFFVRKHSLKLREEMVSATQIHGAR